MHKTFNSIGHALNKMSQPLSLIIMKNSKAFMSLYGRNIVRVKYTRDKQQFP